MPEDRPFFVDWETVAPPPDPPSRGERRPTRLRPVVVASIILGLLIAPFGIAATGDALREGVRNGTATRETQIIARHDGAATRQSNTGSGLAAVYGCRRPNAECTRHVNLRGGPAAAFVSAGNVPFSVGDNTGLVTNLNADKVDGLDAAQLRGQTGPQGPAGPAGARGADGSPDTPQQVRDKLVQVDGSGSGIDADLLDGRNSTEFAGRGAGSTAGQAPMNWYSYFGNTGQANDYEFGQAKVQTTGTAGQFRVCGNVPGSVGTLNYVLYVNGARSTGTVASNLGCSAVFDPGAGGDFQVTIRRTIIFGVHSGDGPANENYNLYGFGQL
jgi:hypothetical protein